MDAGLELFGTVGYRATTVRMLCKQAGLIDRYFYKNFTDTEDLLAAIHTESLDQIQALVVQALSASATATGAEPISVVESGLNVFFGAFENSRVARVCWLEVLGVSPRIDALYTQRVQRFADLLLMTAKKLLPQWSVPEAEARVLAVALVGAISQSALHWLFDNYRESRQVLVSANSLLLRGVFNAVGLPARRAK